MGVQDQKKLIRATREAVSVFLLIKEMWQWSVEREEKRCGDVLDALVRNDQDLKHIALAPCKPKGDDEGIEAFIGRGLRGLHHSFKHHSFKYVPNEWPNDYPRQGVSPNCHSFKYVPNE